MFLSEERQMKSEVLRYIRIGKPVELIYLDKNKQLTRRHVKLLRIEGNYVQAFCYIKRSPRMFIIDNILAICLFKQMKKEAANRIG